jgi:glycerol transport system ATP-binding protein
MIYVTHDQTEALTFADTVVVMHDGAVVQMGSPAELFERPAHTFVGYFIGSPGMNLMHAEVNGNTARLGSTVVTLARRYPALPAGTVEIGIRPEFVLLAPPGAGLPVRVKRIDDLGARRIARVELAGFQVAATAPEVTQIVGEEASVLLDPRQIHVYTRSVRVEGEAA